MCFSRAKSRANSRAKVRKRGKYLLGAIICSCGSFKLYVLGTWRQLGLYLNYPFFLSLNSWKQSLSFHCVKFGSEVLSNRISSIFYDCLSVLTNNRCVLYLFIYCKKWESLRELNSDKVYFVVNLSVKLRTQKR